MDRPNSPRALPTPLPIPRSLPTPLLPIHQSLPQLLPLPLPTPLLPIPVLPIPVLPIPVQPLPTGRRPYPSTTSNPAQRRGGPPINAPLVPQVPFSNLPSIGLLPTVGQYVYTEVVIFNQFDIMGFYNLFSKNRLGEANIPDQFQASVYRYYDIKINQIDRKLQVVNSGYHDYKNANMVTQYMGTLNYKLIDPLKHNMMSQFRESHDEYIGLQKKKAKYTQKRDSIGDTAYIDMINELMIDMTGDVNWKNMKWNILFERIETIRKSNSSYFKV